MKVVNTEHVGRNPATRRGGRLAALCLLGAAFGLGATGCSWDQFNTYSFVKPNLPTETPTDNLILGPEGLVEDNKQVGAVLGGDVAALMGTAREHFRREEYPKALELFGRVADNDKNPPTLLQEAQYYRAECLRLTGEYPRAGDTYSGLVQKFPNTPYREQCVQHMFDIANYWLEETRQEMREEKEKKEGKRLVVWPHFVSFEKNKPLLDREGRAIALLEAVRLYDINGPLADQALFMCGVVKMYNENFRDADHYFSQVSRNKDSKLSARALELAIFCKQMSTGGSDYDGRKTAEARKLVRTALGSPQLAHDPAKRKFLEEQVVSIDMQQAEKDYKMAEFYRRTGHPGSAYFYYELVQKRYPRTTFAAKARERWASLREELEKKEAGKPLPGVDGAAPAAAAQAPPGGWKQPGAAPGPAAPGWQGQGAPPPTP